MLFVWLSYFGASIAASSCGANRIISARIRSNIGRPLLSQTIASPSIRQERTDRDLTAISINGKRCVKSLPLRVMSRTPENGHQNLAFVTRNSSGSLAMFAAIRRASSLLSNLAADHLHEDFTMGVIMSANLADPFAEKWLVSTKSSS